MPYSPLIWVDGVTGLDAVNFNHLEGGVTAITSDVELRLAALAKTISANLDTVTDSGWYSIPAGTANAPIAQKGFLKVEKPNDSWVRQIFYQYDVATPGPTYVRVYNPTPGTWTAWAIPATGADLSFDGDWVAGTYQDGDTVVKDGILFMCVGGPTTTAPDASLWGTLSNAGIGTTLPAAPYDGQEFILTDSLTAPTYAWRFKYLSSIVGANKWLFVGGAPVHPAGAGGMSTSSTSYVDLTGGPTFVIPRAGVYEVNAVCIAGAPGGVNNGFMQIAGSSTGGIAQHAATLTNTSGLSSPLIVSARGQFNTPGETIKLQVKNSGATQNNYGTTQAASSLPSLSVLPVAVA